MIHLSDSRLVPKDLGQDVRRLDLYDDGGEQTGEVADLYVEEEDRCGVRFLDARAGDFLIPVEAVLEVSDEKVVMDRSRR